MDGREKIFIGVALLAGAALIYWATRPVQVDISPAPSGPLPDDDIYNTDGLPGHERAPSVSAFSGMFLYPLAFARPLPITSSRMQ